MTPFEAELARLGVIPKPEPKQPRPPVSVGWRPAYPGEEPPF